MQPYCQEKKLSCPGRTGRGGRPGAGLRGLVLVLALVLGGCFAPRAQDLARNWRPMGAGGLPLAHLVSLSPGLRRATWESFAGVDGQTVVRLAAEYVPAVAAAHCPSLPPGMGRAARSFLLLDLAVTPAGAVDFLAAKAQAYDAMGYYEEYDLDAGVVAALVARTCPIPCLDLALPGYLERAGQRAADS